MAVWVGAGQWVSLLIRGCVKIGSHAGGIVVSGLVVWLDWGALCEDGLAQWRCEWGRGGGLAWWPVVVRGLARILAVSVTDRPLPLLPSPSPHSRSRPLLSPPPSLPTPQACRICGARNHRLNY